MTLQKGVVTGRLIRHTCQTSSVTDPNPIGRLMKECCCNCTPPILSTYKVTWDQTNADGDPQDYFWVSGGGINEYRSYCNAFMDNSPFEIDIQGPSTTDTYCLWQSANYSGIQGDPSYYTNLNVSWASGTGWSAGIIGGYPPGGNPRWTCNASTLTFTKTSDPTNRCDPTGEYICDVYPFYTSEPYSFPDPPDVPLNIKFVISNP